MKDSIEKLELDENIEVLNINDTPVKEGTDAFSVIKNYGEDLTKREYVIVTTNKGKASDCIACGQCEGACPQHLPIIELLQECRALED